MRVMVVRLERDEGSVIVASGVLVGSRNSQILFAGDRRPMLNIAEALENDEVVVVDVEPWQIISNSLEVN